jgi:methyl-accepting chemotaxis protein
VSAIQEGTATVAEGIEQAAEVVHTGLDHVTRTFELLAPIRSEADDTFRSNQEIATAVTAEADLASSVVESMEQVLEMSDQTASVVGQALDTSSAMSRATDAILTVVGHHASAEDGDTTPAPQDT